MVEGPPGTGKTETIVNLCVAALAAGRPVVLLSTKRRALEDAAARLETLGLGALLDMPQAAQSAAALPLHRAHPPVPAATASWHAAIREGELVRARIAATVGVLLNDSPAGLAELARVLDLSGRGATAPAWVEDAQKAVTPALSGEILHAAAGICAALGSLDLEERRQLATTFPQVPEPDARLRLMGFARALLDSRDKLVSALDQLVRWSQDQAQPQGQGVPAAAVAPMAAAAALLASSPQPPAALMGTDLAALRTVIERGTGQHRQQVELQDQLAETLHPTAAKVSLDELDKILGKAASLWGVGARSSLQRLLASHQASQGTPDPVNAGQRLAQVLRGKAALSRTLEEIASTFGSVTQGSDAWGTAQVDWDWLGSCVAWCARARELRSAGSPYTANLLRQGLRGANTSWHVGPDELREAAEALGRWGQAFAGLAAELDAQRLPPLDAAQSVAHVLGRAAALRHALGLASAWSCYLRSQRRLRERGLGDTERRLQADLSPERLEQGLHLAVDRAELAERMRLRGLDDPGAWLEQQTGLLSEHLIRARQILPSVVLERWATGTANASPTPGQQRPLICESPFSFLRRIHDAALPSGDLLLLVDEASQATVGELLVPMVHAHQAVVFGDSFQLGPSAPPACEWPTDGDPPRSGMARLPGDPADRPSLRVHYRAHSGAWLEPVRACSYHGRFAGAPTAVDLPDALQVTGIPREGHSSHRGEAAAICDVLEGWLGTRATPDAHALVVTVTREQAAVVRMALDQRLGFGGVLGGLRQAGARPPIEVRFVDDAQGYSAKLVCLSLAALPHPGGADGLRKLLAGERGRARAIVAATRASHRLHVFHAFSATEQRDMAACNGPLALIATLLDTKRASPPLDRQAALATRQQSLLAAIGQQLGRHGWVVEVEDGLARVGRTGRPVATLYLDLWGQDERAGSLARTVDVARLLQRRGFVYPVRLDPLAWALHWRVALEALLSRLGEIASGSPTRHQDTPLPAAGGDGVANAGIQEVELERWTPERSPALSSSPPSLDALLCEVVAMEGPVHIDDLTERVAPFVGLAGTPTDQHARIEAVLLCMPGPGAPLLRGAFVWPPDTSPGRWRRFRRPRFREANRHVDRIPPEEAANLLERSAGRASGLTRIDLLRLAVDALALPGNATLVDLLTEALQRLIAAGRLRTDGEHYWTAR